MASRPTRLVGWPLRDLGGLTQTIESTRDVRATWLDTFWRDLRYGARLLRRSPRFTVTALTVLVLGIGSTTAIFSIAYAVLVRPLPYADPERLVFLAEHQGSGIAWPNFDDWRQRATSFDGLASSLADTVFVTGGDLPQRLDSKSVTANFFGVLGVTRISGPSLRPVRCPARRRGDGRREPRLRDAGVRQRAGRDRPDALR